MTPPIDVLLSATRTAVRYAAGNESCECRETAVLDQLLSEPFPPGAGAVEPADTPAVSEFFDAAVQAATTLASGCSPVHWLPRRRTCDGSRRTGVGKARSTW